MSVKHRNAGGPFTIFNPGLGVTGSLGIDGQLSGSNGGLQVSSGLVVTGSFTVPNRPFDHMYYNGNQFLYTDENTVEFDQVNGRGSNPGSGNYDTVSNEYTASESGLYMTNLQIHVDDLDNDSMTQLDIYVRMTSPSQFPFQVCFIKIIPQDFANTDTTIGVSRHATAVFYLNAGDKIGVRYDLTGGATGQAKITNTSFFQVLFIG